jgi:hypothetical protein
LEAPPDTQLRPVIVEGMSDDERDVAVAAARDSLRRGLTVARGDSTWLDVDRLIEEIYDPATPASMSRRFYLNQIIASEEAWIAPTEWAACTDATKVFADSDPVVLGFDGSVREDSTALVMCRVSDGHLTLLAIQEKPEGMVGREWQVDRVAIDAAVAAAFARYNVVGFYADPAHWQDYLDRWSAEFGDRLRVSASATRPLEWWTNRSRLMVAALERFHDAVTARELTHDGGSVLAQHVGNAQRRPSRAGLTISKENPQSARKIDAAMAAVLAYEARADAIAGNAGVTRERVRSKRLRRF